MAKLTKSDIEKIANLAKIDLTEKELMQFASELSNVLGFIKKIADIDVSDLKYISHVGDFKGKVLRKDVIKDSLPKNKIFQPNDDREHNGYFVTSKII